MNVNEKEIAEKCAARHDLYNPRLFSRIGDVAVYVCDTVPDPGDHPPFTGYPPYVLVKGTLSRLASIDEMVNLTLGKQVMK